MVAIDKKIAASIIRTQVALNAVTSISTNRETDRIIASSARSLHCDAAGDGCPERGKVGCNGVGANAVWMAGSATEVLA